MKRIFVESSSIASVSYERDGSTLEVEFRSGRRYQYFAVPERVFEALMAATSKGAYLNGHIKNRFPFTLARGNSTQ